jgi:hypothetical protein
MHSACWEELTAIFGECRQAQSVPAEHREALFDIFIESVADLVERYRASIPEEARLVTPRKSKTSLDDIAQRAESLERDARALLKLLSALNERTRASLHALVSRRSAQPITTAATEWLAAPHMHRLAALANDAAARYAGRRGRFKAEQPYRAGADVRALCERFNLPYARSAARDENIDSVAVRVFRIVTGITEKRVERYLPK